MNQKDSTRISAKLALEGGMPLINRPLNRYKGAAVIGEQEKQAVLEVLESQSLFRYYGPKLLSKVATFEQDFARFVGALMDYCCYGAALARHVLGQPSRVTGVMGHCLKDYITLDDNAVIVMQWPRAIAISEASWTQIGHLTSYFATIYGSEGTVHVEPGKQGRLLHATREPEDGIEVACPPLPDELSSATAYFLHCITQDKPIEGICSAEISRDAQEILEAAILSAQNGEAVALPLPLSYLA